MAICGIDELSAVYDVREPVTLTVAAGTTVTCDLTNSVDYVDISLTANITTVNASGSVDGEVVTFRLTQDATGSRTVGWGTMFRFTAGLAAPTITITASNTDRLVFEYNAANSTYDILSISQAYAP